MASQLKTQRVINELTAAKNVINDLVQENYELKQQLRELLGIGNRNVERDRNTSR